MNLCKIENCGRNHWCKGYCTTHYQRFKLYGDPMFKRQPKQKSKCSVINCSGLIHCGGYCVYHYGTIIRNGRNKCKLCEQPSVGKGLCSLHYQRLKRHNNPETIISNPNPLPTCSIQGCNRNHSAKGLCQTHYMQVYNLERRKLVIGHYSGGTMKCLCCGESIILLLTIDHENDNGSEQRQEGIGSGQDLVNWIIKNNFPLGFQVMCFSCNSGRYLNGGICPHKDPKYNNTLISKDNDSAT